MKLKFIDTNSTFYPQAVAIRIDSFFIGLPNAIELINDVYEKKAIHIIYLEEENILGTGRLHLKNDKAIISQMAIHKGYRKQGIGSSILQALIKKAEILQVSKIELSARETALEFYKKYGFETFGELYPSKKTGIIHQKMKKLLQ